MPISLRHFHKTIILLILLIVPESVWAETGNLLVDSYTDREHGGDAQVWSIAQDKNGVIYFGGISSILRFDGFNWSKISVPTVPVRALAVGDDEVVYVGISNEIGYLKDDGTGVITYTSMVSRLSQKDREFGDIWSVHATSHGVYFFGGDKIFRWHKEELQTIDRESYYGFTVGDWIYVVDSDKGVFLLRNGQFTAIPHFDEVFREDQLGRVQIAPWTDGKAWILTQKDGIFIHDLTAFTSVQNLARPQSERLSFISRLPMEAETEEFLKENMMLRAKKIDEKRFAIGTLAGGIVVIDEQGEQQRIIDRNTGLLSNEILVLFTDSFGDLWAGANNGSISHISTSAPFSVFDEKMGLESGVVAFRRHHGAMYFGTTFGVHYLPQDAPNSGQKLVQVRKSEGQAYTLLEHKGVLFSNNGKDIVQILDNTAHSTGSTNHGIQCMTDTPQFPNLIFVGTNGEVEVFASSEIPDTRLLNVKSKDPLELGKIKGSIFLIERDAKNNLWVTTKNNGIYHVTWPGPVFEDMRVVRYGPEHGLPNDPMNRLHILKNEIYVSSNNKIFQAVPADDGLVRFVPETTFGSIVAEQEETVKRLLKDHDDVLWVRTERSFGPIYEEKGGYRWDKELFNMLPGKMDTVHYDDPYFWISTSDATFLHDTRFRKETERAFHPLIQRIGYGPRGRRNLNDTPTLPYEHNGLSFEYTAAYYERSDRTMFSYRMDGFDSSWSEWKKERQTNYTNLPEGKYKFRVKARNVFKRESTVDEFRFSIIPPWYRTIWAYGAYVLAFFAILTIGIKLNSRRLLAAKKRLERTVKERTREIVAQKDKLEKQKEEIESARNALWGEMKLAQKIQTVLLPEFPEISGYQIVGYMWTADSVGGDYYDVINTDGRDWVVIGDVCGHGVTAGLVMMMVQTALRTAIEEHPDYPPERLLAWVNCIIHGNVAKLGESKYMTLTLMSLGSDGSVIYAGLHQDILIYRMAEGATETVETEGIWIGLTDNIEEMNPVRSLKLHPGDTMLLFTDGIVEASTANGKLYGQNQLSEIFTVQGTKDLTDIRDGILTSLDSFDNEDDITMLMVRRNK